jgi:hypothetical protein
MILGIHPNHTLKRHEYHHIKVQGLPRLSCVLIWLDLKTSVLGAASETTLPRKRVLLSVHLNSVLVFVNTVP